MDFSLARSLEILDSTPNVLAAMLTPLHTDWISCNEGGNSWTVAEVVAHLVVCERSVWLERTKLIQGSNNDKTLNLVDMEAQGALARDTTISSLLETFRELRNYSLEHLRRLNPSADDLKKTATHPKLGEITLEQVLAAWTVHDLSHTAQICRIMGTQYKETTGAFVINFNFFK